MKKIFMAVLLLSALNAVAQTEKDNWLIGGGLELKTGKNNSQFSFNPSFGYFIANNFVAGAKVNFDFASQGEIKSNEFGAGPFARYYIGTSTTRPFAVTEFNFLTNNVKNKTAGTEIKSNGFNFLFGIGFAAFVSKNIAIEGISGYNYSKYNNADGSSGFNLRIGFGLYFNKSTAQELRSNVTR